MRIKNRLSPYPILNDFGDDYINSSFKVKYDVNTQFTEVYGKLSFVLENDDIKKLIKENKAVYSVHVECPSTCYREIFVSEEDEIDFKIDATLVSKTIEIRTFVILKEKVIGFESKNFHPDYQGQKFDLEPHQIIAIGTAKDYEIKKDDRDLDTLPSIIRIVRLEDKHKGALSVNTDNDEYIIVGLSTEIYELYAKLGKNSFKNTSFSLVLLPALVVVIQRMCIGKDDETITTMHWYQVIESLLNSNGFDIADLSIENASLLSVCQSIFADPIAKSFKELESWSERV